MSLVTQLLEEKEFLIKRIEAIDILLSHYNYVDNYEPDPDTPLGRVRQQLRGIGKLAHESLNFPRMGRKDKQVLWIFKNSFAKGVKLGDVQDKYNKLAGLDAYEREVNIINVVRQLRKKKQLVLVKYNKSNKLSFWALPDWIENNNFKKENSPDVDSLPIDINNIEIIRE